MDGYEICGHCKGKKETINYFKYKDKTFHYYSKCSHCYAKGKIDWIQKAMGRRSGLAGYFVDLYPAGSMIIDGTEDRIMGGSRIYDGHEYIDLNSERGDALWNELNKDD